MPRTAVHEVVRHPEQNDRVCVARGRERRDRHVQVRVVHAIDDFARHDVAAAASGELVRCAELGGQVLPANCGNTDRWRRSGARPTRRACPVGLAHVLALEPAEIAFHDVSHLLALLDLPGVGIHWRAGLEQTRQLAVGLRGVDRAEKWCPWPCRRWRLAPSPSIGQRGPCTAGVWFGLNCAAIT